MNIQTCIASLSVTPILAAALVAGATSSTAYGDEEEHGDVWIQLDGNQISTGLISEDGDPISSAARVFGAEFGEEPGNPFLAIEPGFQALDGTFPSLMNFRVDIVDGVTGWNGGGFNDVSETMTLEFGPQSVTSGDGLVEGFDLTMDDEGGFHGHFDILLNGSGGDPDPGIYLLSLQLAASDSASTYEPSDTFWFVMNLGQSEDDHEAAIEWVEANLVPAPAALALFLLHGGVSSRRRRQSERA